MMVEPRTRDRFPIWVAAITVAYVVVGALTWHRTLLPDEIRPLLMAASPFSAQLQLSRSDIIMTPGAWMLARGWLQVFGQTDAAAKALALLINIPTLVLFGVLARRVTRHWRAALILCAAAFLRPGSSPNLVRMYGLVLLCTVAAMLVWDLWRERGDRRWLAVWVLCMIMAAWAHAAALFLVPAFVLATWLTGPRRAAFTLAASIPMLSIVPWILYVYPIYHARGVATNLNFITDSPTRAAAKLPFYFLTGEPAGNGAALEEFYVSHGIPPALKWAALFLTVAILAFPVIRAGVIRRRSRGAEAAELETPPAGNPQARSEHGRSDWATVSVILAATPVLLLWLLSQIWVPLVVPRYLLAIAPALWLMLAIHGNRGGWPGRMTLGIIGVWMLASAAFALRLQLPPDRARVAATRIAAEFRPGDMILIDKHTPLGWQFTWEWTHRIRQHGPVMIIASPAQPSWLRNILPGPALGEFETGSAERVWFMHAGPKEEAGIRKRLGDLGYTESPYAFAAMPTLALFVKPTMVTH